MIQISLPGRELNMELRNLLLDLNGTLATDGVLEEGVSERIEILKEKLKIYLISADTFGVGAEVARILGVDLFAVSADKGGSDKLDFLNTLEASQTVAIGNGYNDKYILEAAALSFVIIGKEGCSVASLKNADIAVTSILDALDILINPLRIVATLRA